MEESPRAGKRRVTSENRLMVHNPVGECALRPSLKVCGKGRRAIRHQERLKALCECGFHCPGNALIRDEAAQEDIPDSVLPEKLLQIAADKGVKGVPAGHNEVTLATEFLRDF
jgi:hypothetical protein